MEIKNCSIYPRYEESLPKISRIPEFALFMYHRHGKSNRVKCLPHSNGQALRAFMGVSSWEARRAILGARPWAAARPSPYLFLPVFVFVGSRLRRHDLDGVGAEAVDAAGDPVADLDRADAGGRAGIDQVARLDAHRAGQDGDDLRNAPDKVGDVLVLLGFTIDRQPDPAVIGMTDFLDPAKRRDHGGVIERLVPIPGPPFLTLFELKCAARQVVADGKAEDVIARLFDGNVEAFLADRDDQLDLV